MGLQDTRPETEERNTGTLDKGFFRGFYAPFKASTRRSRLLGAFQDSVLEKIITELDKFPKQKALQLGAPIGDYNVIVSEDAEGWGLGSAQITTMQVYL